MLVKGRGINFALNRARVAYLILLIIMTFDKSMIMDTNHTVTMIRFFFISISI